MSLSLKHRGIAAGEPRPDDKDDATKQEELGVTRQRVRLQLELQRTAARGPSLMLGMSLEPL